MINLRYHIVSITAVFLALAIGLTLGTSFLDRVTVDSLKERLDTVEREVRNSQRTSAQLRRELDAMRDEAAALDDQLPERLLSGLLDDVPVLVVAPRGIDDGLVERSLRGLRGAGASVQGIWWLSDRFVLDDEEEVLDLRDALGTSLTDKDAVLDAAAAELADVLIRSSQPVDTDAPSPTSSTAGPPGAGTETTTTTTATAPEEPELASALHDAGFLDYEGADRVLLPPAGTRVVMITDRSAVVPSELVLLPLLRAMAEGDPLAVVAATPTEAAEPAEEQPGPDLVDQIRDDDVLGELVTTVDDLDHAAGIAALVLGLHDHADAVVGHYGTRESATHLLPPPEPS